MNKKACLLLCYTNLASDPRVRKHFEALRDTHYIFTAGVSPIGEEYLFVKIEEWRIWDSLNNLAKSNQTLKILLSIPVKLINYLRFKLFKKLYYWRYWDLKRIYDRIRLSAKANVDLIVCNDVNTLPLAVSLARKKTKILYDAHEYHAEEHTENYFWRNYNSPYIDYLYRRYIYKVHFCITVSDNIAKRYYETYKMEFKVVLNTPAYIEIKPSDTNLEKVRIAHSGMWAGNRKIEELIRMMSYLPSRYELHLLLTNTDDKLMRLIANAASKSIYLHTPVQLNKVSEYLSQFDIGVHLMAAENFNNDNALPNKYFQYIQARLVTAFGPLSEITTFTRKFNTGIISSAFTGEAMAEAIMNLSNEKIAQYKQNNDKNAKLFNEENEILKLKKIYNQIML